LLLYRAITIRENLSFLKAALILLTIGYAIGSLVDRAFVPHGLRRFGVGHRLSGGTPSFPAR
jgi:hypothetical protein